MLFGGKKICELEDWSHIDYVCLKAKTDGIYNAIYYLDGHQEFEKTLTVSDMDFINFTRRLGCYGVAEKMIGDNDTGDRFYIRINISNKQQETKIIDYLTQRKSLSVEQQEILKYLCNMDGNIKSTDYKPLYYCGFSKETQATNYESVRFYFKTFETEVKTCHEYINYCEQCLRICNDPTFQIVKRMVLDKKIGLRCIGIEISDTSSVKIKYYLSETNEVNSIKDTLLELRKYPRYSKQADELLKSMQKMPTLHCNLLQISDGYDEKSGNINMYLESQMRDRKKYYSMREGLILRDIGGISFLVDIHEKHYYDLKNLFSVNETGKIIIKYIMENGVCTLEAVVSNLRSVIKNYRAEMYPVIYEDCQMFIEQLRMYGYLQEEI